MKKIFLILLLPLLLFVACDDGSRDDKDDDKDLVTVPDADPADDGKATGVYKGVVAGDDTSGTFMIDIASTASGRAAGDVYAATIYFELDGEDKSADGTATEQDGGSLVVEINFTVDGYSVEVDLIITSTGSITSITVTVDGYGLEVAASKEESDALVEAWQGTFSGQASGTWNFLIEVNSMEGVYAGPTDGSYSGTISGSSVSFSGSASGSGTFDDDEVTGVWSSSGYSGTWSGERTR